MFNFVPANLTRRSFGSVALAVAAADVLGEKTTQASQPTTRVDILTAADGATLEANKGIEAGDLFVSYADIGPATGSPVLLLHGWRYDINSFALVAHLFADRGHRVIVRFLRGYGGTRFLAAETKRNGQQAAIAVDTIKLMDALGINQATIAGFDWGARTADIVAALWPERCKALVSVSGYLIGNQSAGKGTTAAVRRTSVVVSILFRHRSRSRRLREIPERLRQVYLAARLPTLEIRRRNVLAKRRRIRQSRPCGDRRP